MDNGTIQQLDSPESIVAGPANAYVREFVIDNLHRKIDSLVKYVKPGAPDNRLLSSIWNKIFSLVKNGIPQKETQQEPPKVSSPPKVAG